MSESDSKGVDEQLPSIVGKCSVMRNFPHPTPSGPTVEALAVRYAVLAESDREQAIDGHALAAIRERGMKEVVLCQRVRFRARLLCAVEQRRRDVDHARQSNPFMSQSGD